MPDLPPITAAAIRTLYRPLDSIGFLGAGKGYHRPAYSVEESAALHAIEALAQEGGLATAWDAVGNLTVALPGSAQNEWIETGSHLDTVPGGGNFDGGAGVVAGLAVLLTLKRAGTSLKRGLRLRVWRGEESSSFGAVSLGSRAAFGLLPPETLEAVYRGESLRAAMLREGGDPGCIERGEATIPPDERDGIHALVELHIEQGRVLAQAEVDVGIVTGIRGSVRSWVRVRGRFDHSGATPMGASFRRDVNLAIAHMQVALDELRRGWSGAQHDSLKQRGVLERSTLTPALSLPGRGGKAATHERPSPRQGEDRWGSNGSTGHEPLDLVQTIGVVNSHPDQSAAMPEVGDNAIAKVSGAGYFSHEVRSCSGALAHEFAQAAFAVIRHVAEEFGVEVEIDTFSRLPGIETLDAGVQAALEAACRGSGASCQKLPSGAWHDAAVVAGVKRSDGTPIPVGMLFIPCREGISHNPAEFASDQQIALGANVLMRALVGLANR